jgi:hypothetical protein
MPLPEGYLPRKGDIVLVQARAKRDTNLDEDSEGFFELVGREHRNFFMLPSEIHSIHCRKWEVDDRVRIIGTSFPMEVIGVCDDKVWCRYPNGTMATYEANQLEPYTEPAPGSQSIVGDDEEIKF